MIQIVPFSNKKRRFDNERKCIECECPWTKHKSILHDKEGILKGQEKKIQENLANIDIVSDFIKQLTENINKESEELDKIALRPEATVIRKGYIEMLIANEKDPEKLEYLNMLKRDAKFQEDAYGVNQ